MTQRYPGFEEQGSRRAAGYPQQGGWRSHDENEERWRSSARYEGGSHEGHFGGSCPTCGATACPTCGSTESASYGGNSRWDLGRGEHASFATPPRRESSASGWSPVAQGGPRQGHEYAGPEGYGAPETSLHRQGSYRGTPSQARGFSRDDGRWSSNSPSIYGQPGAWRSNELARSPSPYVGGPEESSWSGSGREGRGPKGYKRSDDRIREDISDRLMQVDVDAGDVTVNVKNGEVTLEGTVNDRWAKRRIEDLAEGVLGASQISNHLRIETSGEGSTRSSNRRDSDNDSARDRSQPSSGGSSASKARS